MASELFTTQADIAANKPCRKASLDFTDASTESPSCDGYSSSDDAGDISEGIVLGSYLDSNSDDMDDERDCMSPYPSKCRRLAPGMSIKVWRRTTSATRMEWAEVIRASTVAESECLICETLLGELFEFSPELVAQGCDNAVEAYDIVHEDARKDEWRAREVARLHSILSESGRLVNLPDVPVHQASGFIVGPSQFCVKATVISSANAEKRLKLQENIQQELLSNLAGCGQMRCSCGVNPVDGNVVANVMESKEAPMQRWLQSMKSYFRPRAVAQERDDVEVARAIAPRAPRGVDDTPECAESHIPELCSECIRSGTWCCGTLHLPDITARLDAAVTQMHPSVQWSPCEAGVEAEVEHKGERLLLQIRPRLFFIPDRDAKLFG